MVRGLDPGLIAMNLLEGSGGPVKLVAFPLMEPDRTMEELPRIPTVDSW